VYILIRNRLEDGMKATTIGLDEDEPSNANPTSLIYSLPA
jgi:hypothetical protein